MDHPPQKGREKPTKNVNKSTHKRSSTSSAPRADRAKKRWFGSSIIGKGKRYCVPSIHPSIRAEIVKPSRFLPAVAGHVHVHIAQLLFPVISAAHQRNPPGPIYLRQCPRTSLLAPAPPRKRTLSLSSRAADTNRACRRQSRHARCASTPSGAELSRAGLCSTGNGGSLLVRRPPGAVRARVHRRRRDRAAAAELLRHQLPQRRVHRALRHLAARPAELRRRARHAPPLLPRLLRPGVRRVGDADGGERGRREPQRRGRHAVARRRGGHQQGQGRRRGAARVRRQGLLRRHPRHGRARRRLPDRRAELRRGAGTAGRQVVQQIHREARPPGPRLRPQPAQRALRHQRPHPVRHDRALRCAHDRGDALRQVRAPDLHVQAATQVQPADEPRLPAVAAQGVPHELPAHGVRHAGRDHAQDLRQRLLRQSPLPEGPARLRPGALHRPPLPPHRQPLRRQLHRLLRRLRRRHGQAGTDRGQDRQRRRGAPGLHRRQLAFYFGRVCVCVRVG